MAWDSDKSTAADPNNPQADEQLTAGEWDNHVTEGHFPSDELNFGVNGSGDPVITDPQNGGQTVMRYDRSAGSWFVDALEADQLSDGIAGTGNSISAVSGDDGEYLITSTVAILPGEQTTLTSDSFTSLGAPQDFVTRVSPDGLTNADNAVAKVSGRVASLDQDVTIRYRADSDTEVTVSSAVGFEGDYGDVTSSDAMIQGKLETQTGSDDAELDRLNITFALEIGT